MQVDMSGAGEMKARFLEKLESMQKPINSFYIPSIEKYEALIKEVEEAKQVAKKQLFNTGVSNVTMCYLLGALKS